MYNNPIVLLKGIKGEFWKLMQTDPNSTFTPFIFRTKSNSNKEDYWIPESMPAIKEWIDMIGYSDVKDQYLEVLNKDWENSLLVDRNTLDDSKVNLGGNVEMWIKSLANTYQDFPDELCQALLAANSNAFDGTAFFANSRTNIDTGSNTIDNLYSGTGTTFAQVEADYIGAKKQLEGFRDKNDRAFNKGSQLAVFCPKHMEDTFQKLLNNRSEIIHDGTSVKTNIYAGTAEIVVNWEQGSSDNDWYLINKKASFPPFLIQDRQSPDWNLKDEKDSKMLKYFFTFRMGYSFLNPMSTIKIDN
jgi:phage major head subunit gpT-like protein